jgi:hypothetical protein
MRLSEMELPVSAEKCELFPQLYPAGLSTFLHIQKQEFLSTPTQGAGRVNFTGPQAARN